MKGKIPTINKIPIFLYPNAGKSLTTIDGYKKANIDDILGEEFLYEQKGKFAFLQSVKECQAKTKIF